jgi:hypothetical protein
MRSIYYVEITTLFPDGTLVPNLRAQIGSHSQVTMNINGDDYVVNQNRSPQITFPNTSQIGIKMPNHKELIPPTFW